MRHQVQEERHEAAQVRAGGDGPVIRLRRGQAPGPAAGRQEARVRQGEDWKEGQERGARLAGGQGWPHLRGEANRTGGAGVHENEGPEEGEEAGCGGEGGGQKGAEEVQDGRRRRRRGQRLIPLALSILPFSSNDTKSNNFRASLPVVKMRRRLPRVLRRRRARVLARFLARPGVVRIRRRLVAERP